MRPRTGWLIFLVAVGVCSVWLITTLIDGTVSHARDIPRYQNAQLIGQDSRVDPARPPQHQYFTTDDSSSQVEAFYRNKLQEQSWTNAPQFIGKVWPVGLNS